MHKILALSKVSFSWLLSFEDAKKKGEDWIQYYNWEKPHGSLGNAPPLEFAGAIVPKQLEKHFMIDPKWS